MKRLLIKLLLLLFLLQFLAAQNGNRVISLEKQQYTLGELLEELHKKHGVSISYGNVPSRKPVDLNSKEETLDKILDQALEGTAYTYQYRHRKVLIIPEDLGSKKYTISGFIKDSSSGEALIGATVFDQYSESGTLTNAYGFFSLTITGNQALIEVSYLGFEQKQKEIQLKNDITVDFSLTEKASVLKEVTISGSAYDPPELNPQMSAISLTSKEIEHIPMILGERDILKAIQLLPGIQSGTEGTSGIYVRGGGPDQNLILLDGVPIYNSAHLFSAFSIFNPDAINQVEVIKGGFPARYGGRLSSVIDISMKEGNNQKLSGLGSIGLVSSKVLLEGPIKNEKTSFIISGRRTYFDFLPVKVDEDYYFYDFNAKINHTINSKNRVFLSFYGGRDFFRRDGVSGYQSSMDADSVEAKSNLSWGNFISVFRWNHIFSPKLFANFSGTFSRYQFQAADERRIPFTNDVERLSYNSGIEDFSLKLDFDYQLTPNYNLKFGASSILHDFNTGVINFDSNSNLQQDNIEPIPADEHAVYLENDFSVGNKLRFNMGVHSSMFNVRNRSYSSIQPRVSGRFLINSSLSLKASYSEMTQFIHLLTNSGIGLPTDLWVPATDLVAPQFSKQYALGAAKSFQQLEFTIESYYKTMGNLIEYENGASYVNTDTSWENKVEVGDGTSYGIEFLVRKRTGRLTGWIGYTLSKTTRQFDNLNFGRAFPYKFDRRHDISIVGTYQLKQHFTLSTTWVFGSGNNLTLPFERYLGGFDGISTVNDFNNLWFQQVEHYATRNNYRMRSHHRLDISGSWEKEKKRGTRIWSAGVYNVYARLNPFYVYVAFGEFREENRFKQVSFLSFIPYVSYTFKF